MEKDHRLGLLPMLGLTALIVSGTTAAAQFNGASLIGDLNTVTTISTTVPSNGDTNPYGVARVPGTTGKLIEGQFLISNFNNTTQQGLGTTIVEISPTGSSPTLFAQIDPSTTDCPGGVGLTTALVALRSGFVIVGSLPTADGTSATAQAGCLIVLDSSGKVVETFKGGNINGPWDMTADDDGSIATLYVTNVLNGTVAANGAVVNGGTVVRIRLEMWREKMPKMVESTVIATGFPEQTNSVALVIGPTGVAFDEFTGTVYVADTFNSRIAAIPNAAFRRNADKNSRTVSQGGSLNGPLGLVLAPNHHLVAANGGDGNLVEVNPFTGKQVATNLVDNTGGPPPGAGALFGLFATRDSVYFVDDDSNTFNVLH